MPKGPSKQPNNSTPMTVPTTSNIAEVAKSTADANKGVAVPVLTNNIAKDVSEQAKESKEASKSITKDVNSMMSDTKQVSDQIAKKSDEVNKSDKKSSNKSNSVLATISTVTHTLKEALKKIGSLKIKKSQKKVTQVAYDLRDMLDSIINVTLDEDVVKMLYDWKSMLEKYDPQKPNNEKVEGEMQQSEAQENLPFARLVNSVVAVFSCLNKPIELINASKTGPVSAMKFKIKTAIMMGMIQDTIITTGKMLGDEKVKGAITQIHEQSKIIPQALGCLPTMISLASGDVEDDDSGGKGKKGKGGGGSDMSKIMKYSATTILAIQALKRSSQRIIELLDSLRKVEDLDKLTEQVPKLQSLMKSTDALCADTIKTMSSLDKLASKSIVSRFTTPIALGAIASYGGMEKDAEGKETGKRKLRGGIVYHLKKIQDSFNEINTSAISSGIQKIQEIIDKIQTLYKSVHKLVVSSVVISTLAKVYSKVIKVGFSRVKGIIQDVANIFYPTNKEVADAQTSEDKTNEAPVNVVENSELEMLKKTYDPAKVDIVSVYFDKLKILMNNIMPIVTQVVKLGSIKKLVEWGTDAFRVVVTGIADEAAKLGKPNTTKVLNRAIVNTKMISLFLWTLAKSIFVLSVSVAMLVLTAKLISSELDSLLLVGLFFGGVLYGFYQLATADKIIGMGLRTITKLTTAVAVLAGVVITLVLTSMLVRENWEGLGYVALVLVGVVGVVWALATIHRKLGQGVTSMHLIALGVLILSLSVAVLCEIAKTVAVSWSSLGYVAAVFGGVLLATVILAATSNLIGKGVIGIIMISVGVLILSVAVGVLAGIASMITANWEGFGYMSATLGIILGLFTLLAVASPYVLIASGVALVFSGAALLLAGAIGAFVGLATKLSKAEIDTEGVKKKTNSILNTFVGKGGIVDIIDSIPILKLTRATIKTVQLSGIVGCVGRMAKTLSKIASLKFPTAFDKNGKGIKYHEMGANDFAEAASNGISIVSFFTAMFDDRPTTLTVGGKSVTIRPISMSALNKITLSTRIKFGFLNGIVKSIGGMASTVASVASLKVPIAWDKDGNPTEYKKISDTDFTSAKERIAELATFFTKAIADASVTVQNVKKKNLKRIKLALSAIEPVVGIVDTIKTLAEGTVPIYKEVNGQIEKDKDGNPVVTGYRRLSDWLPTAKTEIERNITSIITSVLDPISRITSNDEMKKKLKVMKDFNEDYGESIQDIINTVSSINASEKGAETFKKNVASVESLITKINSADVSKLTRVRDMFKYISELSKSLNGNIDKLAKTINDNLVVTLKDLKEVLEEVNETLDVDKGVKITQPTVANKATPSNNNKKITAPTKPTVDVDALARKLDTVITQLNKLSGTITTSGPQRALKVTF